MTLEYDCKAHVRNSLRSWDQVRLFDSDYENHTKYGEFIYAYRKDTLYVNLFIPSQLTWKEQGIILTQETRFPDDGKVTLRINEAPKKKRTLMIRIPEWANQSKGYSVSINGKRKMFVMAKGNQYLPLSRKWEKGDVITFHLPMKVSVEQIPDKKDYYAFLYGPIVLAASTGTEHLDGLYADDSRGGHIAAGPRLPLQTMPVIVGDKNNLLSHLKKVEGKPLTFTLSGVYPERYEGMTVEPFFRL